MTHDRDPSRPDSHPAGDARTPASFPLWILLVVLWLASLANVTFNLGVYFVTDSAFGFSKTQNLLLGLTNGAAYIPGALLVGPLLRRTMARRPGFTPRLALAMIMLGVAGAQSLPAVFHDVWWMAWPAGFLFNGLSGAMWPIVESYVSGGRRGPGLRRAIAAFNITWASTTFASGWLMAPLVAEHPLGILAVAGVLQLLTVAGLFWFPAHPAKHISDEHEPHPPVYRDLLAACRWLLPLSYVLCYCLAPMLPQLLRSAGSAESWATPVASTWGFFRWGVFILLAVWGGWHGKWSTLVVAAVALFVGFGVTVAAWSVPAIISGLALFGVGMGGVYATALYYVMEVGAAEVEAGGSHEALIGVGFVIGPGIGIASVLAAPALGGSTDADATALTLVLVGLVGLGVMGGIASTVRRRRRQRGG